MYRFIFSLLLLIHLPVSNALSLSIRHEESSSSLPFELIYHNTQSLLNLVLQVVNDSETTANVLSWQLELELRPTSSAQGELRFYEVSAPADSLFGPTPGPQSDLSPPSSSIFVFDTDPEFEGEPITPNSSRNILQLSLEASPATSGAFQMVMPEFVDPEADSSWFDANEFIPKPFDNSAPSEFPGMILLGTIIVNPSPNFPPGDYNMDTRVDEMDYDRWRKEFGTDVGIPGQGADGNRDGIVNAGDYIIWRSNEGIGDGALVFDAGVPEPRSFCLMMFGLVSILGSISNFRLTRTDKQL